MRGVFSAKWPDSSVGGVPVVYCTDDDHMEEEDQLSVQVEEEDEMGETHVRDQGEQDGIEQTITQAHDMDDYADETKRAPTLEPCRVMCDNECVFTA